MSYGVSPSGDLSVAVIQALTEFIAAESGGDVNDHLDTMHLEHPRLHPAGGFAPHMLDCGPNGRPATQQVPDGHGGHQTFYYCVPL